MAKTHPQDTILVRNIDVDCNDVSHEIIATYYKEVDEDSGESYQRFGERPFEFDHSEGFVVRWAGQPHRIKPGETKLLPRFVAEHFAKHLADHILGKRELLEKKTGYITSAIERPKVLDQVLVKVVQHFEDNGTDDEGLHALEQVESLNASLDFGQGDFAKAAGKGRTLGDLDAGVVPDKTTGVLTADTPQSEDEALVAAGEQAENTLPTRPELIKEAHALGIKVIPTDTRESLAAKIKSF